MRLIDADAVLTAIEEIMKSPWYNRGKTGHGEDAGFMHAAYLERKEAVEVIRDLCIKGAPTVGPLISVKEVRQALKALYSFCNSKLQNTNPIAYVSRCDVSFVDLMDDEVTNGFGNWMRANGVNATITATQVYIKDMLRTLDELEDEPAQEVSGDAVD